MMKKEPEYIDVDTFVPGSPDIEFVKSTSPKKERRRDRKVVYDLTGPGETVRVITFKKKKKPHDGRAP